MPGSPDTGKSPRSADRASATRLIIWRHGETDWNNNGRLQGQSDVPLNDRGRQQADRGAAVLAALRPDALVASDLTRAADTAAALAARTGLAVHPDPRLRERDYGLFQGLTQAELGERYPREYAAWRAGDPAPGCGVESLRDLGGRVGAALGDALARAPGGLVVVATHGGAARQGCGALLGWPPEVLGGLEVLGNCRWAELRRHPVRGWLLCAHNVGPAETGEAPPPADPPPDSGRNRGTSGDVRSGMVTARAATGAVLLLAAVLTGCADGAPGPAVSGSSSVTTGPATPSGGLPTPALPATPSVPVPWPTGPGGPGTDKPIPPSGKAAEITVTGQVVDGVEPNCRLIQGKGGSYLLIVQPGADVALRVGARFTVRGVPRPDLATMCMEGQPLLVSSATPAR